MGGAGTGLEEIRAAIDGHAWQAAFDAASAVTFEDPAADAERLDLLAEAAWWLGRLETCTEAREAAYRTYDDLGEHRAAGMTAVWLYEHHAFCARGAIAGAWLRRARRALEGDVECEPHAALLLREAETMHGRGKLADALTQVRSVIELARRLRSKDLEAEALQAAGRVLIDMGEVAEGMAHLDEAMLFAVEGRLRPYSTGKVYCSMIGACEEIGDFDRAAEWTEATDRWTRKHPFTIFPGICRVHRAIVLKRRGALEEAEREASKACDELLHSRPVTSAQAWAEVGDICRRLGHLERAEEAFDRSQELAGGPCAALALLRLAQGRVDAARSIIDGCLAGSVNPLGRAASLPTLIQVAVAAGDLAAARAALVELEATVAAFGFPEGQAALLVSRGRVLLADHDPAAAAVAFREALERWRALEVPYEVASAGTLLGQALRDSGDEDGAVAAFASASALFDQIGARMVDHAAAAGAAGPRVLPAGLTEREVEVLQQVAAGLTNNEIAASLFLSAKTVSRHLSNIFTKIGVTSRAAATAFAFEHDLVDR